MLCTSNPHETLLGPTSRQTGKPEGNASKAIRANSHNNKVLARPLLTPLQHQDHGTINQSQWISIELECREEIGEDEEEVHREGM